MGNSVGNICGHLFSNFLNFGYGSCFFFNVAMLNFSGTNLDWDFRLVGLDGVDG